jgi:hypothetical protein
MGCVGIGRTYAKALRRKIEYGPGAAGFTYRLWRHRFDGLLQIRSTKNRDRKKKVPDTLNFLLKFSYKIIKKEQ